MEKVWINGRIIPRNEAVVDIEDRAYQFGDGIYEVISIYNGKTFKMDEHLERLERNAKELSLPLKYSREELKESLEDLRVLNDVENGMIYLQVSRGMSPRSHEFPSPAADCVVVGYTRAKERPVKLQEEGVTCLFTEDIRWLRCDIKTLNLLGSVLARQKAIENDCYEAILHRGDTITEGASSNLFMVKDNKVYTHPANHFILDGITRQTVIELCKELNIEVREETFSKQQLLEADEAFLTGTSIDVLPVINIDQTAIGLGTPGLLTKKLQKYFNKLLAD